jgi:uncharacterized membrane protein YidH (DUF202 family)
MAKLSRMPMPPFLLRLLRFALIGTGAITLASGIVNIIAAVRLIEPADEASLGVTRGEVIGWFIGPLLFGVALITLGLWRWKKRDGSK